jgi:hypothetical protein
VGQTKLPKAQHHRSAHDLTSRGHRGVRNWDFRYCWVRDTTFTLLALMNGGYKDKAESVQSCGVE